MGQGNCFTDRVYLAWAAVCWKWGVERHGGHSLLFWVKKRYWWRHICLIKISLCGFTRVWRHKMFWLCWSQPSIPWIAHRIDSIKVISKHTVVFRPANRFKTSNHLRFSRKCLRIAKTWDRKFTIRVRSYRPLFDETEMYNSRFELVIKLVFTLNSEGPKLSPSKHFLRSIILSIILISSRIKSSSFDFDYIFEFGNLTRTLLKVLFCADSKLAL